MAFQNKNKASINVVFNSLMLLLSYNFQKRDHLCNGYCSIFFPESVYYEKIKLLIITKLKCKNVFLKIT